MEKLGDYEIISQIGKGSLGTAYVAEHRYLKKKFILKVFPEEFSSDKNFIARFEKEIAEYAKLDHPHIVKVHNVSHFDGYYFLVSDCILDPCDEMTNLAQYLTRNKKSLSENEILEILTQVASALSYAHKQQIDGVPISHRGLKLNNILIGKGMRGIHVYLSDFGLSKILGEGALLTKMYQTLGDVLSINVGSSLQDRFLTGDINHSKLTKLHISFLQNYAFLAPEQKIYREKGVANSSDTFAFGVLAYFLIMRCFPEGFFPLPSKYVPDYRLNWDMLIYKCMQPNPSKRPVSLSQLIEELVSPKVYVPNIEQNLEKWSDPVEERSFEQHQAPAEPISSTKIDPTPTLSQSDSYPIAPTATLTKPALEAVSDTSDLHSREMISQVSKLIKENAPKPKIKPAEIARPIYEQDPAASFHVESTVAPYRPKEKEIKDVLPIDSEMIVISGGEYSRGSNEGQRDERPSHKIVLPSFGIDIHPVSNEQFALFLEAMGGEKDSNNHDIIRLKESRIKKISGKINIESGYSKHPVVGVSWYGAIAYAKWVGKRLPTEAEYEIAARGSLENAIYPTGIDITRDQANYFSADTTPVMSFSPNSYGIYDLAGNVYEWCQDWYDYSYYEVSMQEPTNPKGPPQGVYRVLRGGCWKSLKPDMRITHRHRNSPGTINKTYGFRCAADAS